ncbi:hypothetical protein [Halobacillus hunanensis]|uniref:hypothetical protein n=1 Tax=Halobacillus hunanensis TaxID=578214 RepID=UPI0009A5CD6F|nr:hypothetical protein [Halobacillus hunanensis]
MKKILLGVLAVSLILGVMFIFMSNDETGHNQVNAENSTEIESVDKTHSDLRKQAEFTEAVSNRLNSKGYDSTGVIMSQDYGKKVNYIVLISKVEHKGKKSEKIIKQTFEEVAKLYDVKPFTVQLQQK